MDKIIVEQPKKEYLEKSGILKWPIWEKEKSKFDWYYDSKETCYLLKGNVIVTPENGEPVKFGAGDLVIFPKGMKCVWEIQADVKKHYKFE